MIPQDRRNQVGTALVLVAVVLFVVPPLFPVEPVLVHDTGEITNQSPEQIEEEGVEIVAYEDLSDRGQELYRRALENGGEYRVARGEGAPEFEYLTAEERAEAHRGDRRSRPGSIVVERPENSDLPPADERYFGPRRDEENVDADERRRQVMRYDVMSTATEAPPLGARPQLLRLAATLFAVVSLGIGGYFLSSK